MTSPPGLTGTNSTNDTSANAFRELTESMQAVLETYSNVHRGSGHHSIVTTRFYEHSRNVVLDHFGLNRRTHTVLFCSPRPADRILQQTGSDQACILSSEEIGLALGIRALAIRKSTLARISPFYTGGGTARLVGRDWVISAGNPGRFEAGTPAILNAIALARALQILRAHGLQRFETISDTGSPDINPKTSNPDIPTDLSKLLIGNGYKVPSAGGDVPFINFDNGASTPSFDTAFMAALRALRADREERRHLTGDTRKICREFLGAPESDYDIVFTANTTEGINLAAESIRNESGTGSVPAVLISDLEHNSNDLPWRAIPGCEVIRLPVDDNGFYSLEALEAQLLARNTDPGKNPIALVSVSGASNILGSFPDLMETARIVHRYGARLMVDAAQLVAHRPVDMAGSGIDYLAFSGHKAYAPFGTGVLAARKGMLGFGLAELSSIHSSGEENSAGIAALGSSLTMLTAIGFDRIRECEYRLTAKLLSGMRQIPGITIPGVDNDESPDFEQKGGVIVFGLKGAIPGRVARRLAERAGIGVRYGCHCTHVLIKKLLKMTPRTERIQYHIIRLVPQIRLQGLVRVSLGIGNTESDADRFLDALKQIAEKQPQPDNGIRERMKAAEEQAFRRVFPQG